MDLTNLPLSQDRLRDGLMALARIGALPGISHDEAESIAPAWARAGMAVPASAGLARS